MLRKGPSCQVCCMQQYLFDKTINLRCLRFQARGYAAQAGAKIASKKNHEVETTTLPNKLIVASVESNSPISRVSVLFRLVDRLYIASLNMFSK